MSHEHCKNCGACSNHERCSCCGCCRNCGQWMGPYITITPAIPVYPQPWTPYINPTPNINPWPWPNGTTTISTSDLPDFKIQSFNSSAAAN